MIASAPLVEVIKTYNEMYTGDNAKGSFTVDELECGHVFTRDLGSKPAARRRCWNCAAKRIHDKKT